MTSLRHRLSRDEGFTLIELLVVIVIIGILLAIAVPSYLGFKTRANQKSASANVRAAIPAVEAFYADCGKYADSTALECSDGAIHNFDLTGIREYDSGAKFDDIDQLVGDDQSYCIHDNVGGEDSAATRGNAPLNNGDVTEGAVCP